MKKGRDAWIAADLAPPGETPRTLADWLIRAIIPDNANDVTGPAVAILNSVAEDLATLSFYWSRADMERGELPGAEFVAGLKARVEAAIQVIRHAEGAPLDDGTGEGDATSDASPSSTKRSAK